MMREPIATAKTRQVRVSANVLMKKEYFLHCSDCASFQMQLVLGFAQGSIINVTNHYVVSGL
mgnify:CR=1 FL=1|jgi:hypothetical protein